MRTLKKLMLPAALLLTFPLTGCSTITAGIDSGCKSFNPISWSKADTPKTKTQVVGHNKAYDAICKG
jgi:hypothetical protein